MGRTALHKITPKSPPYGAARSAEWDNGVDLKLKGYWLNPETRIQIEVPIFPHEFEPNLTQSDTAIRRNTQYRMITLPSLSELRAHGIEVDRAAIIAEVLVAHRHIRNFNFFRGDFPALVKGIAKRDNVLLILPANDMPSARLKRKKVLGLWRLVFTPLILKGKHYFSGRMGMYMAAPPGAAKRFKDAFNFHEEKKDKQELMEWHPSVNTTRQPRRRGPKPVYNRRQQQIAAEVIAEASEKLRQDLFPIVADKIHLDKTSPEGRELQQWLGEHSTSRELLRRTQRGGKGAVRTWVNQVLAPKVKEIVRDEVGSAAEGIGRWVVRQMIGASVAMILDSLQQSKVGSNKTFFGRMLQKMSYDPSSDPLSLGPVDVNYRAGNRVANQQTAQILNKAQELYLQKTGDFKTDTSQIFHIETDPKKTPPVSITLNKENIEGMVSMSPEVVGKFSQDGVVNQRYYSYVEGNILRQINSEINRWVAGGGDGSDYAGILY